MFCNRCGKTLGPDAKDCSSCGQPVGDSRFEGSGYTSSQVRFVPEGAEQTGYAPYTKTTYSSMNDEGGDVYSRTSYRPALAEGEGGQTTGTPREDGAATEGTGEEALEGAGSPVGEGARTEPTPQNAPRADGEQPRQTERDALGIEIKPLAPIKKTGISPAVQRYIEQMNYQKGRKRRKAAGEEAAEAGADGYAAEGGFAPEESAYAPRDLGSGARKWAVRVAGVMGVIVVLVAAVLLISYQTASRSKIPGVTYALYNDGLALIKTHATNEYREGIIKLWRADNSGAAAETQQKTERDQINALLPEKPLENDQQFVNTLLSIQDSIETATMTDAIAALGASSGTLASMSEASNQNWKVIENAITRLEMSTDASEMALIIEGAELEIPTVEPEPVETPSPYKTLKKGMKNNRQVYNMQERLRSLGWFNGKSDGDFGPATQTAVKKFQNGVGLEEDGIATPELQELLFAEDAPRGDGGNDAAQAPAQPEGGEAPAEGEDAPAEGEDAPAA
jgi:hypothetical protein